MPAGDPAAAARALGRLLADAGARRAQSEAGRRLAADLAPERTLADAVAWLAAAGRLRAVARPRAALAPARR